MLSQASHGEYADGTDRQTDRCQTVTLRFSLDAASVIIMKELWHFFPITSCVCNCSRVGCLLELDVLLQ